MSDTDPFGLAGRVAVVTGAGGGLGRAHALLFAKHGAKVVVNDLGGAADGTGNGTTMAEKVVQEIKDAGGEAVPNYDSVSTPEGGAGIVQTAIDAFGKIDILVNNAGILLAATLEKTSIEGWDRVIAVNQTGVFLGMRTVAPVMKQQRRGSIVNISSVAGLEGVFGSMAYTASKFAVRGMTKVAAKELGPHNVRVNSIHPGLIDTDMTTDFPKERMLRAVPLGREAEPGEVAAMALFLASDEGSYCTGQEFVVDGGMHA
jgi:3alpha(or 20beta)-hydroxysteroid dehydrogenase